MDISENKHTLAATDETQERSSNQTLPTPTVATLPDPSKKRTRLVVTLSVVSVLVLVAAFLAFRVYQHRHFMDKKKLAEQTIAADMKAFQPPWKLTGTDGSYKNSCVRGLAGFASSVTCRYSFSRTYSIQGPTDIWKVDKEVRDFMESKGYYTDDTPGSEFMAFRKPSSNGTPGGLITVRIDETYRGETSVTFEETVGYHGCTYGFFPDIENCNASYKFE